MRRFIKHKKIVWSLSAIILTASIMLSACDKDNSAKEYDIYVAGYESIKGYDVAMLWKNGTAKKLSDGTNFEVANSIFVLGADVYVVGYKHDGTNSTAMLWKNGKAQELSGTVKELPNEIKHARAYSIFVAPRN